MWLKAVLLLVIGVVAAVLLWLQAPSLKNVALLALCIWAFCRAYYFAFYVIEHYLDPSFRFAGMFSFVRHCWKQRQRKRRRTPPAD